jgi:hypothetical protein
VKRSLSVAVAVLLLAPAAAFGKVTADFTYASTGKAAAPGAIAGTGTDGTFEDIPFTIAADDSDGTASVEVHWTNGTDDFDLTVYKKNATGGLDAVGSSAGGPPSNSEATSFTGQSGPVAPGDYVIRVQNYAATSPDFAGSVKFTEFKTANVRPTATLKVPNKPIAGKAIKLDASGSSDSDGSIAAYAWDLDGDGAFETAGGASPTLSHAFSAGVHHVTVRVIDDRGGKAYATGTVKATKPVKKKKKRKK